MRGPRPEPLTLSDAEKTELERLVRPWDPQQLALRERMILAAAEEKNNSQIARDLGVCIDTVRMWRRRWIGLQAVELSDLSVSERLEEISRSGRPAQITAEQCCQLITMACEAPLERPISQWTAREIAEEAMTRGIAKQISPRHAARLLKKGTSSRA